MVMDDNGGGIIRFGGQPSPLAVEQVVSPNSNSFGATMDAREMEPINSPETELATIQTSKRQEGTKVKAEAAVDAWAKHAEDTYQSDLKDYIETPTNRINKAQIAQQLQLMKSGSGQVELSRRDSELSHQINRNNVSQREIKV